jgi:8-oxo-dGTP pyrophosphatase MutT (NUDIX family)
MLRQIAALPVRANADGTIDVFLVTSRGSGRWIIPKGNPISGLSPPDVAAREAREEAGLVGQVRQRRLGSFEFHRLRVSGETCRVDVYPMHVEKQLRDFDEKRQRTVRLCNMETALSIVCSRALAGLIEQYGAEIASQRSAVGT